MSEQGPSQDEALRDRYVISRLRHALRRDSEISGWRQVSRDICAANGGDSGAKVDRRTLPRIVSDDDFHEVKLTVAQLIALDKYLVERGDGTLFARDRSLIDSLAESASIAFYVASKYHGKLSADAVSAWDLRAITSLLSMQLNRRDIKIVQVEGLSDWKRGWSANRKSANVVVGSPIANVATDELLMRMLGFRVTKQTKQEKLPFFIVGRTGDQGGTSGFVRTRLHAVRRNAEGAARISKEHRALVFGKEVFACDDNTDYALLLAQRDPASGHVSTVLAGLSGIGTFELAQILQAGGPAKELFEWKQKQSHPPILATIYKLTITTKRGQGKKNLVDRRVVGSAPVLGPRFLHYSDGVWRYDI